MILIQIKGKEYRTYQAVKGLVESLEKEISRTGKDEGTKYNQEITERKSRIKS